MKKTLNHRSLAVSGMMIATLSFISINAIAAEENKKQENTKPAATEQKAQTPNPGGSEISKEKSFPKIASGPWKGPKLADGQPDIQGHWSNTISNHSNFTDPQGGIPNDPNPNRIPKGPREDRAPSRVSDPVDGHVPFQPWALEKVKEFQIKFHNPTEPQFVEPLARCAPGGVPKSLYWHGYEIAQYPNYVVFSLTQERASFISMANLIYLAILNYGMVIHAGIGKVIRWWLMSIIIMEKPCLVAQVSSSVKTAKYKNVIFLMKMARALITRAYLPIRLFIQDRLP